MNIKKEIKSVQETVENIIQAFDKRIQNIQLQNDIKIQNLKKFYNDQINELKEQHYKNECLQKEQFRQQLNKLTKINEQDYINKNELFKQLLNQDTKTFMRINEMLIIINKEEFYKPVIKYLNERLQNISFKPGEYKSSFCCNLERNQEIQHILRTHTDQRYTQNYSQYYEKKQFQYNMLQDIQYLLTKINPEIREEFILFVIDLINKTTGCYNYHYNTHNNEKYYQCNIDNYNFYYKLEKTQLSFMAFYQSPHNHFNDKFEIYSQNNITELFTDLVQKNV